jgi:hypothetical protein
MEWLDKLQIPGLILAGFVIASLFILVYKLIDARNTERQADRVVLDKLVTEVADGNKVLYRAVSILDLICQNRGGSS